MVRKKIPNRVLREIFISMPNITSKQLQIIRESACLRTYKKFKRFAVSIDQSTLDSLKKDAKLLADLSHELLVEDDNDLIESN